jgi:hypothetical protein
MATTHVLYSNTEIALLFNYADYCLAHDRCYKATVVAELKRVAGTTRTKLTAIGKLRNTLVKHVGPSAKPDEYIQAGTTYLDIKRVPVNTLMEMNRQRETWGFEPLATTPALAHTPAASDGNVGNNGEVGVSREAWYSTLVWLTYLRRQLMS